MKKQNKDNEPYAYYRFCCKAKDGCTIEGMWLDITKDTTPEFLQDGLDFLLHHTVIEWWIEYR